MAKVKMPEDKEIIIERALRALGHVKPSGPGTVAPKDFLLKAARTNAGRKLPSYYLVYFLLHDLLGFRDLGKYEKVSWSIPIDYKGKAFVVEHRKFGLGVFAYDPERDESDAKEITKSIQKAVNVAKPYYEWLASEAVSSSNLNVKNNCSDLFGRYEYLLNLYEKEQQEAILRKDEVNTKTTKTAHGSATTYQRPYYQLRKNSNWLAISAIEAFFSWTENLFVHLAIVARGVSDGDSVANLAMSEWQDKFTSALDIGDLTTKKYFDELVFVRRQLRNFIAHGAFGKNGETFEFHSSVGAVPVIMPHQKGKNKFSLFGELSFNEDEVIRLLKEFTEYLWKSDVEPAMYYVMESYLPVILTMSKDGSYSRAMSSRRDMEDFVDHLNYRFDQAANMDW
ncbi:hypothetical protein NDJ22_17645 [Vibrio alginolyticus]|uniref:hypothetical protein n=1 Tax=Vibrio alginolyticus TaxID=663 RepID=UPI0021606766|nr:hypothetical protein [Vibrio alginolyticus]MCS0266838.1 hypothetical protein [Vibrio alginolyticus]